MAAILLVSLLAPLPALADYSTFMGDAQRTGVVDAGPPHPGVAWRVDVGGKPTAIQGPAVADGMAYVLAMDEANLTGTLWRIDVQTGQGEPWVQGIPMSDLSGLAVINFFALGAGQAVVQSSTGLAGYDLADGEEVWRWKPQDSFPGLGDTPWTYCINPAIHDGTLIAPCATASNEASDDPRSLEQPSGRLESYVLAFDLSECRDDCIPEWIARPGAAMLLPPDVQGVPVPRAQQDGLDHGSLSLLGVTLSDDHVAVSAALYPASPPSEDVYPGWLVVWVLDRETGRHVWDDRSETWLYQSASPLDAPGFQDRFGYVHVPSTDGTLLYYTFNEALYAKRLDGEGASAETSVGGPTAPEGFNVNGIAIRGNDLWITSVEALHRFDRESLTHAVSSQPLTDTGQGDASWARYQPLIVAGDTLFAATVRPEGDRTAFSPGGDLTVVHAYDAETLQRRWSIPFEVPGSSDLPGPARFAVSYGMMVVHTSDGWVYGIGGPEQRVDVSLTNAWPAAGETVWVNITEPGARFMVDWGEGLAPTWTDQTSFSHAFEDDGPHTVTVLAGDDDEWKATSIVIDVGGAPEADRNPLAVFINENPDAAWGIFGLIVVLVGAAFTSYRLAKRRGLMARELAAIDAAADEAGASSTRLHAAMDERRARAHGLLLDHRIDESQYQILGKHIDEAGRGIRMHRLRELFGFLPFDMVRSLEQMLEDGQITAVERRGIQAMLDDNEVLTKAQKGKVGELVEEWFAQDEVARG